MPGRALGSKRCGAVHRFGHPLRVYVIRGRARVLCARARALVRRPPLRPIRNWQRYDWRRTHAGPWAWVYRRRDHHAVVAAIAGRYAAPAKAAEAYIRARARYPAAVAWM